ncbi:L-glutamate ABC transporter membrane protein /L-aspartate ABC transporter membrane protein [Variovorax sp. YR634]|uniref:amino acid ABC transporter permease n=1 Tax=Variovorax sp. YR634 TaxID=1884385 RepID=UPI00089A1D69|nr:amino acid ABC transporter permease [Variovorax sp. YR634]SDZ44442.1 L-glutamate ABC transporter membrane protein /L-aspartate ABC transporter membrane protein [Variovorax sp. YR634]
MAQTYSWNWSVFLEPVSTGEPSNYLDWLLAGLYNTIVLGLLAIVIALAIGTLMGILRTVPNKKLRSIATVYVAVFRNVPVIVQLFAWYFVMPEVVPGRLGTWFKELPSNTQMLTASVLCIGLYMGARVCEHVRSGIGTLPPGQRAAALALGLTLPQAYRYVLLPVAFRVAIPPLSSEFVNVFKNSAVASTIGLLDLSAQSQQVSEYTAHPYESFIVATLIYMTINMIVMFSMRLLEKSLRLPGYIGGK